MFVTARSPSPQLGQFEGIGIRTAVRDAIGRHQATALLVDSIIISPAETGRKRSVHRAEEERREDELDADHDRREREQ